MPTDFGTGRGLLEKLELPQRVKRLEFAAERYAEQWVARYGDYLANKYGTLTPAPPDLLAELKAEFGAAHPDLRSCFLFALAKSGSTMLNRAFRIICQRTGIPSANFSGFFFQRGVVVDTWIHYDLGQLVTDGYCYNGFRYLPTFLAQHELLQQRPSVLLVRDVRDAATSHYYSIKHEHPVPGGGRGERAEQFVKLRRRLQSSTVDDHVLTFAQSYVRKWREYRRRLPIASGLTRVYRYEDVVFSKTEFLTDVANHCGLDIAKKDIRRAVSKVDVFPTAENVNQRARVVKPGNHREKLKPETIERLNSACADYLRAMNYA